jgi:tetratricopeptide (TPR) repeat protein
LIYAVLLVGCIFYTLELYPKNKAFGRNEKEFWLGLENRNRENFLALFNIGIFSLPENEEQALEIFQKILEQKDHHLYERFQIRIYEELASYYTFRDKLEQAEYYFNRLLGLRKYQSQHFFVTYACFLAQKGKVDEGKKIIRQMLDVFSENHLILLHSAKFYIILKDYEKAIELLKKDFALFPTEEIKSLLNQIEKIRKAELYIPG